jgi:hypothetical protein
MKIRIIAILMLAGLLGACVDDYTEFNPPRRLDAPVLRVNSSSTGQVIVVTPVDRFSNANTAYVEYGTPIEFTISVIKAPGKFASVSVAPSVPDFGSVTIDEASVSSLVGKEVGQFKFTFTPNANLPDEADRALNLVVSVTDGQLDENGEPNPKTTTLTLPTNIVSCISEGIPAGVYQVTAASGNLDGGAAYTLEDIEADAGADIFVTVSKVKPGRYTFNEVTGGIWPTYYGGRANPALRVDLCGADIVGHPGEVTAGAGTAAARTFTLSGELNGDGTIDMTWSYVRNDGATPANPAKGTYTLTPVN